MEGVALAPKVSIDYSRCTVPFTCIRCLRVCDQAVFLLNTLKQEKGKETDKNEPGAYRIDVWFRDRCNACMDCIKVCPVDAITVTPA